MGLTFNGVELPKLTWDTTVNFITDKAKSTWDAIFDPRKKEREALSYQQQQLEDNQRLQQQLIQEQIEQARQQAAFQIQQRKQQGLQAYGGLQAWAAASGLQGASANRLGAIEQYKTEKAVDIIDINLNNYVKQAKLQGELLKKQNANQQKQLSYQIDNASGWNWGLLAGVGTAAAGIFTANPGLVASGASMTLSSL